MGADSPTVEELRRMAERVLAEWQDYPDEEEARVARALLAALPVVEAARTHSDACHCSLCQTLDTFNKVVPL